LVENQNKYPWLEPKLLLHPNIPKPMHGVNPRSIKGEDWWNTTRREIYEKQDFRCAACGTHKTEAEFHQWLEAHESYTINYKTGVMRLKKIYGLCHCCHSYIHTGLLAAKLRKKQITKFTKSYIERRGASVLVAANLSRKEVNPGEIAAWDKWHLVFGGKKYYSKFKSYDEWRAHYG